MRNNNTQLSSKTSALTLKRSFLFCLCLEPSFVCYLSCFDAYTHTECAEAFWLLRKTFGIFESDFNSLLCVWSFASKHISFCCDCCNCTPNNTRPNQQNYLFCIRALATHAVCECVLGVFSTHYFLLAHAQSRLNGRDSIYKTKRNERKKNLSSQLKYELQMLVTRNTHFCRPFIFGLQKCHEHKNHFSKRTTWNIILAKLNLIPCQT